MSTAPVLRSFRPLFEALNALVSGRKVASLGELSRVRAELHKELTALKTSLTGRVSDRESYLMLFALVVHLDEVIRTSFPEADRVMWPLLQQELFATDRGGELFYQAIGEILETSRIEPAVPQVYYFCMSLGFVGKLAQEPERRKEVMDKLRERLVASAPSPTPTVDLSQERPPVRVPLIRSAAWPWAIAGAALLALHVGLSLWAAATVSAWREAERAAPTVQQAEVPRGGDCKEGDPCRSS
jgi:type IV/VI secretion system ImpK/VasF family protein